MELSAPGGEPVQIYIGSEAGLGRLPLSVLVSTFACGAGGRRGHLVVIGPSRMSYQKNVAMLSFLSGLLGKYIRSSGKYLALVALVLPGGIIVHQLTNGMP